MSAVSDAHVTVVGGGAMGAAALFALTSAGYQDIQLIEANDPASATTSQAAGLVGQVRGTVEACHASMRSADLYRRMESEFGTGADWRETGSLRLALSEQTEQQVRQLADVAGQAGLHVELLDARATQDLMPALEDVSQVRLALWCPSDGYIQPNSVTAAYVAAARAQGARVVTGTQVHEIRVENGRACGVMTDKGTVNSDIVVIAAGPWSGALARTAGVDLPVVPVLVQDFITEPHDGWHGGVPVLRVPEIQLYARGEVNGILVGGFENVCTALDPRAVTLGERMPRTEDWDTLAQFGGAMERLVPSIAEVGVRAVFTGWPGFTPDGGFLIGPVSSLPGLVMFAGCNAHGVQGSAELADVLVDAMSGVRSAAVEKASPDRFLAAPWDSEDARQRAASICANYYPRPS